MEQSDLDLLQTAPPSHLQALVKARQMPIASKGQTSGSPPSTPALPSSLPVNSLEIAQYLFDPTSLAEAVRSLSDAETMILRELVECGGRANSRDLALYLTNGDMLNTVKKDGHLEGQEKDGQLADGTVGYQTTTSLQYPVAHPHGAFEQSLRRLLVLGLLFWGKQTSFASRDYTSGIHDGVLIVPLAVRDVVHALWPEEDPFVKLREQEQDSGEEAGRLLQRSLYLYWSLVASLREGLSVISSGLLSRSSLRQVTDHMGYAKGPGDSLRTESDVPYLLFVRLLLMKAGLLQERQSTLYALPIDEFFSMPLLERARRCYRLWLETPFWNEMNYLPEVNVRPGPGPVEPAHEEVVRARHTVVERLVHEQIGVWQEVVTFIARTKLYVPYLLFPRQYGSRAERYSSSSNPYGWDFRLRRGWLTHREGWHMVEGGFVRAVVGGPLHWLGVVDVDREESPTSFRLAPAIASIISDVPPPVGEVIPAGRLIVQPNFELVALAPVSETLLVVLDRFAERISLEHIAQYRLTKASVTRAIQMGLHAGDIREVLERAAGGEIPQNVQYSLVEWERQARRVEVWQSATLLEVDEVTLLDDLLADERAQPLLGRRLAPLLVEVMPGKLSAIQEMLWQRNYLPALVSAPTQDVTSDSGRLIVREPQWRLHSDGLLQPFYAVLDLYLVAEAERFSEKDALTGWRRITASSLQRALAGSLSLEQVVRFLQQYCEDGIPGSFLIRLKLWGGGYDERKNVYIEQAPLLRLSEHMLRDLQADEELQMLLGSEVEPESRLVHVKAEDLERVMELLRDRGFTLD